MALNQSPKIVTDGLIFYYDMNNGKSFVGAPVTNTLPSPAVNGLPTFGNGWGTYNTNQYNNNQYFSIGAIASVTSNIVTTTGNHPLRSYDVVTPQTTGGGVTAGVNYLVKKLSNTTFSLHPYNSSQDGSQGFINPATGNHKVYDDFSNDVRISINATSFPTMWWGPPHLPNSALVKEIIPNGFTGIPGRLPTDCIRNHFNRTDATDGMSYGPDAAVVAGVAHTVSFWARSVTASAVGTTGSYQIYNYGATTPSGYSTGFTLGPVGVWQKYTLTFTPNNPLAISYWFPGAGGIKYDISNIQFEPGTVANNFAPGTRANTETIRDLTNNNIITANSLTYESNGTFSFNGSSNLITFPENTIFNTQTPTVEVWVRTNATSQNGFFFEKGNVNTQYALFQEGANITWRHTTNVGSLVAPAASFINTSQYAQIVGTYTAGDRRIYVNGIQVASDSLNYTLPTNSSGCSIGVYGGATGSRGYYFNGTIGVVKVYNRALSAAEVQQNFNALRGRYGL